MTTAQVAQAFTQEERQAYIGCSELGAIVGLDKWKTPLDVYNQKLGLVEPFLGNQHTERGRRLESVAADIFTEITGMKLRRRSEMFIHPEHRFIVGHIDRIVQGQQRIAEIKCPSLAAFRRMQREGLPDSMIVQMQGYLGLSGFPSGTFLIFCADQMDLITFDVEFDATVYEAIIQQAAQFWQKHILPGIPPELDANAPKIEFEKTESAVTARDDANFAEAVQLLREADNLKRDGEELYELAKGKLLNTIEFAEGIYEGSGLRLHYKSQPGRKTFDKKALAATHPEIDLSRFEKEGKPFVTFRPVWLGSRE